MGNGHLVVVEDNDHPVPDMPDLVERLPGDSTCQAPVSHNGHHMMVGVVPVPGCSHACCGRQRRRGMTRVVDIIGALPAVGKPAQPLVLPEFLEQLLAACDNLVGVALVADIPDDLVVFGVKNKMKGQCQLHDPQIRREMAACF